MAGALPLFCAAHPMAGALLLACHVAGMVWAGWPRKEF